MQVKLETRLICHPRTLPPNLLYCNCFCFHVHSHDVRAWEGEVDFRVRDDNVVPQGCGRGLPGKSTNNRTAFESQPMKSFWRNLFFLCLYRRGLAEVTSFEDSKQSDAKSLSYISEHSSMVANCDIFARISEVTSLIVIDFSHRITRSLQNSFNFEPLVCIGSVLV